MTEENKEQPVVNEEKPKECERTEPEKLETLIKSEPVASTMRVSYMTPITRDRTDIARRRAYFKSQLIAQALEEIKQEKNVKDPVEPYCTTYDDMYTVPGFKVKDEPEFNEELHLKYPLYRSQPVTVYSELVKNRSNLPGITKIKNVNDPFRSCGEFTKPVHLRYDSGEC